MRRRHDEIRRWTRVCGSALVFFVASMVVVLAGCGGGESRSQTPQHGFSNDRPLEPGIGQRDSQYKPKNLSPKIFKVGEASYAPMDMTAQTLELTFDIAAKTVRGSARILFRSIAVANPVFLLDGTITHVDLDGSAVSFRRVKTPDGVLSMIAVDQTLNEHQQATLDIYFELPADRFSFSDGGVGFLVDMADLSGRFFERFGPVGFEDDTYTLTLRMKPVGGTSVQKLFANGTVTQAGPDVWEVRYPSHYTMSSFFVHFTNRPLVVRQLAWQGSSRLIPITVYSASSSKAEQAAKDLPELFSELESDYGSYPHDAFIAYIGDSSGGMEYVGATITSLGSLDHELMHSWFARGVMPAEGRAGWIDEAMASWRDYGYKRATSLLSRPPTSLGKGSVFQRATPKNSYVDGRALLAELDQLFAADGGLKPLMRAFAEKYRYSLVTTDEFETYLETKTGKDVSPYFERYVFGNGKHPSAMFNSRGKHPTSLTREELQNLR